MTINNQPGIKAKAKNLYVIKGYNAKQVSQATGVTEKTIGIWVKKYKWKEAIEQRLTIDQEKEVVYDLRDYLIKTNPTLCKEIEQSITNYLVLKSL